MTSHRLSLFALMEQKPTISTASSPRNSCQSKFLQFRPETPSLTHLPSINARRSGKTFENLTMQVDWMTPLEKLDALEKCLNDWLSTEQNRWFEPSTSITLQNIAFQRYMELTIGIGHNG